jgi:hypothetical protein
MLPEVAARGAMPGGLRLGDRLASSLAVLLGGCGVVWLVRHHRLMERSEEILDRAVGLPAESHERWDCVVTLHRRGDAATFHAAADLLRSFDPARRVLAVDVLAQLGAERNVPVMGCGPRQPASEIWRRVRIVGSG